MTVTITAFDILATVQNRDVRDLLHDAIREVEERTAREAKRERERLEAERTARESSLRIIYSDCAALLPMSLQRFATVGEPCSNWQPPAGDGARYWIKIELPDVEVPLMARFERRLHITEGRKWRLVDYVLPGILDLNGMIVWSLEENYRTSCGQDVNTALANLAQLLARARNLRANRPQPARQSPPY